MKLHSGVNALLRMTSGRPVMPVPPLAASGLWCILLLALVTGGTSRSDTASILWLRPASALALGVGLATLRIADIRRHATIFGIAGAIVALLVLQLVPLPPRAFSDLPDRPLVDSITQAAGMAVGWRPMTIMPLATLNALFACLAPAACLVFCVQLQASWYERSLNLILLIAVADFILSIFQILDPLESSLYFHSYSSVGSPVGFFANRNHHALFLACMLPLIAVWGRMHSGRTLAAVASCCIVVLVGLLTGSRSGVLLLSVGLAAAALIAVRARRQATNIQAGVSRTPTATARAGTAALLLGVVVLAIWLGRALAVERLSANDPMADMRVRMLPYLGDLFARQFPWGSGVGTFEQLYAMHEPDALLAPVYMNHAHNDFLEIGITGGLPAMLIASIAIGAWSLRALSMVRPIISGTADPVALAGLSCTLLCALASATDYPLRVPALACLFACAAAFSLNTPEPTHP